MIRLWSWRRRRDVAELELLEAEDAVAEPPAEPVRRARADRRRAPRRSRPTRSARGDPTRAGAAADGRSGPPVDLRPSVCHRLRMNVRTNLLLPSELVEQVDHFAGPRGRSRYVAEALERSVRRDRLREAVTRTAGVLGAADYPEWSTSDKVVEWVRARRSEVTDAGSESGS